MNIDRNNCELYFLDYLEGTLPAEETAELLLFVEENPDLKELIENEAMIGLVPDLTIHFNHKASLKREMTFHDESGILYPDTTRLRRNSIGRFGVKRVIAIIAVAASVLFFSTLLLKYIEQPIPGKIDKQIAQTFNRSSETKKALTTKDNTANIKSTEINRLNYSKQVINFTKQETKTSERSTLEGKGIAPPTKRLKSKATERITAKAPSSLMIRQSTLLATTRISVPRTIERRTDFDGITSTAYYDPDPDALPLHSEGKTISGRLGYTLAKGISQTAGTIAREPEFGRFLSGKFSLSAIAGLGLAGFNLITDSNLSISRDYDSDGHLKGYSLNDGTKRLTRLPRAGIE